MRTSPSIKFLSAAVRIAQLHQNRQFLPGMNNSWGSWGHQCCLVLGKSLCDWKWQWRWDLQRWSKTRGSRGLCDPGVLSPSCAGRGQGDPISGHQAHNWVNSGTKSVSNQMVENPGILCFLDLNHVGCLQSIHTPHKLPHSYMHKYPHTHTHTSTYIPSSTCLYCYPRTQWSIWRGERCSDIWRWESLIEKSHPEASLFSIIQAEQILGFFPYEKRKKMLLIV